MPPRDLGTSRRLSEPLGLADGVTFPRVLGIEATGTVAECPGAESTVGQQVAALMGGMGRIFDGGYAEYVPAGQVVAFTSMTPTGAPESGEFRGHRRDQ